MNDYKLVPVGPTPEMVEAAEDAYMPFGDMELAIRMAVLAAPDVQGEPDTHSFLEYPSFEESANFDPVPAVQGEPVVWSLRFRHGDKYERVGPVNYMTTFGSKADADIYANRVARDLDGNPEPERRPVVVPLYVAPPAAQKPEPDVAQLVEALEEGLRAIGDHHAPGDCYATGPMTGDPFRDLVQCPACSFIAMCDDLLAAYRKQEPSHDNQ